MEDYECRNCGCNDTSIVRSRTSDATLWAEGIGMPVRIHVTSRSCNHCGTRWTVTRREQVNEAGRQEGAQRRKGRGR